MTATLAPDRWRKQADQSQAEEGNLRHLVSLESKPEGDVLGQDAFYSMTVGESKLSPLPGLLFNY